MSFEILQYRNRVSRKSGCMLTDRLDITLTGWMDCKTSRRQRKNWCACLILYVPRHSKRGQRIYEQRRLREACASAHRKAQTINEGLCPKKWPAHAHFSDHRAHLCWTPFLHDSSYLRYFLTFSTTAGMYNCLVTIVGGDCGKPMVGFMISIWRTMEHPYCTKMINEEYKEPVSAGIQLQTSLMSLFVLLMILVRFWFFPTMAFFSLVIFSFITHTNEALHSLS